MKVSVVVAVFNPGEHIDVLVRSLLAQSLPDDEYEAILVDDSSTDATPAHLDDLAAQHEVIKVLHNAPNSGWPGRPRNLGIDAARGEFVYFVDNDDWLEPEALERMYDYAVQNGSDIVWGRIVGDGRRVAREIFRKNLPDAKLGRDPLLSLLTPHKLFRTAFLREHAIRFPEGRRRLEDHVFVMTAYFAAGKISILADYPCYHWVRRADATNASYERLNPVGYFGNVREVLDIVEANTAAGEFRDKLLAHWYGGKSLIWFEGEPMLAYPDDYRRELFDTVRTLVEERFSPDLDRFLAPRRRVAARLVRSGDLDGLLAWARWTAGLRARAVVDSTADDNGRLRAQLRCWFEDADGRCLAVERVADRELWRLPDDLGLGEIPAQARDVTGALRRARVDVMVRNRSSWVIEFAAVEGFTGPGWDGGVAQLRAAATMIVDPAVFTRARFGPVADVVTRFSACGLSLESRPWLGDHDGARGVAVPAGPVQMRPYGTQGFGNLSLKWTPAAATPAPSDVKTPVSPAPTASGASRTGPAAVWLGSLATRLIDLLDRGRARLTR